MEKTNGDKQQQQIQPKAKISMHKKVIKFFSTPQYMILQTNENQVLLYHILTKKITTIPILEKDYFIQLIPPYIFAVIFNQFITLYEEIGVDDIPKPITIKISKLQVKAICPYNSGYFMGGYNRSILPGNQISNRRQIYYIPTFSYQKKNKPQWTYPLPKSQAPVSILLFQNPYLVAYCEPAVHIINIRIKQTVLKFEKKMLRLIILQGRYAATTLNLAGISIHNTFFAIDIDRQPIYGMQPLESEIKITCLSQSRTGRIYGSHKNELYQINPRTMDNKKIKQYDNETVIDLWSTAKNSLLVAKNSLEDNEQAIKCIIDVYFLE